MQFMNAIILALLLAITHASCGVVGGSPSKTTLITVVTVASISSALRLESVTGGEQDPATSEPNDVEAAQITAMPLVPRKHVKPKKPLPTTYDGEFPSFNNIQWWSVVTNQAVKSELLGAAGLPTTMRFFKQVSHWYEALAEDGKQYPQSTLGQLEYLAKVAYTDPCSKGGPRVPYSTTFFSEHFTSLAMYSEEQSVRKTKLLPMPVTWVQPGPIEISDTTAAEADAEPATTTTSTSATTTEMSTSKKSTHRTRRPHRQSSLMQVPKMFRTKMLADLDLPATMSLFISPKQWQQALEGEDYGKDGDPEQWTDNDEVHDVDYTVDSA